MEAGKHADGLVDGLAVAVILAALCVFLPPTLAALLIVSLVSAWPVHQMRAAQDEEAR